MSCTYARQPRRSIEVLLNQANSITDAAEALLIDGYSRRRKVNVALAKLVFKRERSDWIRRRAEHVRLSLAARNLR